MKYAEMKLGTIEAIINKLGGEQGVQRFLAGEVMLVEANGHASTALDWSKAYALLGLSAEYSALKFEELQGQWTIPVVTGVTCNKVVTALKQVGSQVWLYCNDLDRYVTVNDRDPSKGSYAISVRAIIEADEEFKNLSANELKRQNHQGVTLLERLLLELAYFLTTGKHLDVKNWTLCTGSRRSNGGVPIVSWSAVDRKVKVGWYSAGRSIGALRSRSVVSVPVEPREAKA